jgi:hypothetical protein
VEAAIETATGSGVLTRDIGSSASSEEMTDAVIAALTPALTGLGFTTTTDANPQPLRTQEVTP